MIVVKLSGGIGNQMFQYAAAKALAVKNDCELQLDTSFYKKNKVRTFELSHFNISARLTTNKWFTSLINFFKLTDKNKNSLHNNTDLKLYVEPKFEFDLNFFQQKKPLILEGYWQSDKYFKSVAEDIVKEFQWLDAVKYSNTPLFQEIKNCTSVAIHIRRGDYANNPIINSIHGVLSDDYYLKAIELIKTKVKIDQIYIFTDDNNAAETFIKKYRVGVNASIILNNAFLDFFCMQNCKCNIIANSSFSWWSAWLNANPSKIVVAPKNWFVDKTTNINDLFPESWITL